MIPPRIRRYIDDNRDAHLSRLFELLAIPSIANRDDDGCQRAADWLVTHLRSLGLQARSVATPGKPNVLAASDAAGPSAPTLLVYGHYDVQPPDPLELWHSEPFAPQVRDGAIYARGANDDKGQLFAQLLAVEAWARTGGLPVNLRVLIEGEEEVGSPTLEPFIAAHGAELRADACVLSDSEFFAPGLPSITYALRGLAYFEVFFRGPATDIHSGIHGGAVTNPVNALAAMVAALHDAQGRVTLDGFYDDVRPLADDELAAWRELPFDERAYAAEAGVAELGGGERGLGVLARRWGRPTLDCNGIVGGYTGPGSKTIIPAAASVKISCRLVSDQDPRQVERAMRSFVAAHTPAGIESQVRVYGLARPVMLPRRSPAMQAAAIAYEEGFGRRPAFIRCGASVPVTELFQRLLGLDAVLMGFGLPSDGLHAPNEHFELGQLWGGAATAAAFMGELARGSD
jgi:acetylornithine deacetylase/succinyl-diaminopimelate desuccinylase-like protein